MPSFEKDVRINEEIKAKKVRLIGPNSEQIGIVSIEEALKKADEYNLDLVEVASNTEIPVCKLINYEKYRYEKQKREKEARKRQKSQELKEIRFGINISNHDLGIKLNKAKEFLKEKNKVKFSLILRGREHSRVGDALNLLNKIVEELNDIAKIEKEPKSEGRFFSMVLQPK